MNSQGRVQQLMNSLQAQADYQLRSRTGVNAPKAHRTLLRGHQSKGPQERRARYFSNPDLPSKVTLSLRTINADRPLCEELITGHIARLDRLPSTEFHRRTEIDRIYLY